MTCRAVFTAFAMKLVLALDGILFPLIILEIF